eukprot:GHUV01026366.1.p1 GENE.GHUV01026366.1~~GHUV01026366.1.p1  ORF type:complete len:148 (-),score=18.25 GHUV01026366.1:671-1114(-)
MRWQAAVPCTPWVQRPPKRLPKPDLMSAVSCQPDGANGISLMGSKLVAADPIKPKRAMMLWTNGAVLQRICKTTQSFTLRCCHPKCCFGPTQAGMIAVARSATTVHIHRERSGQRRRGSERQQVNKANFLSGICPLQCLTSCQRHQW